MAFLTFSRGIYKIPYLHSFLNDKVSLYSLFGTAKNIQAIITWGNRPTGKKAENCAKKKQLPLIRLEDGFLRSLGLGINGYPPLSLVYDDLGIYYNTKYPSRLEKILLEQQYSAEDLSTGQQALALICQHKLSKYNQTTIDQAPAELAENFILVVDQTFGDMAVKYGQAGQEEFDAMLYSAIEENPNTPILIKTHPDVLTGKKQGYLTQQQNLPQNVQLYTEDIAPLALLEKAQKVYCVTSQLGFEALMANKPVITFGLPWYAGWGVTDDRHPHIEKLQQRRVPRTVKELFTAAYLKYSRYINPTTGEVGNIFDVIQYLIKGKEYNQYLAGDLYIIGFSWWKKAAMRHFFKVPACRVFFVKNSQQITPTKQAKALVWGKGQPHIMAQLKPLKIPVFHMEDGFIRSIGLGSNLVAPLSLVIDNQGIYFDANEPSKLETILNNKAFSPQELQQAQQLISALIQNKIGKYNVGNSETPNYQGSQTKILVVGQVEGDASIQYGSPKIKTNLELLQTVRQNNPQAWICYKPHPDVVSGNRVGHIPTSIAQQYADEISINSNILSLINQVDEVHTLTSLAGFEALLRKKKVHTYGLPFYAGWGLTVDLLSCKRRKRHRQLTELVAATLIDYPIYISPITHNYSNGESIINILAQQLKQQKSVKIKQSYIGKQKQKLQYLLQARK